jgi:hypothetical protein
MAWITFWMQSATILGRCARGLTQGENHIADAAATTHETSPPAQLSVAATTPEVDPRAQLSAAATTHPRRPQEVVSGKACFAFAGRRLYH